MPAEPVPTLAARFALVVKGLRDVLAAHMVRADRTRPLLRLLYYRLGHLDRRIALLTQRLAAGRRVAPRSRPRPPAEPAAAPEGRPPRNPTPGNPTPGNPTPGNPTPGRAALRLPTRPGWLVAQAWQTSAYGNYFRQLLEDPEMVALLAAAPQLKRQLRAVLRLLMHELPDALALPPRPPRAPRPKPPRAERPKKPRRAPCHGAFRPKEYWRPGPIRPIWTA